MSVPASGIESLWRNNIDDVVKMLNESHKESFMIWNVSERSYNYEKFNHQILAYGFPDHHPPPLDLLFEIVNSIYAWLKADPAHIAIVHCKGGKGRTGTVISCLMFYYGLFDSVFAAEAHFAKRRSLQEIGVTQPSQRRYIGYFETVLKLEEEANLSHFSATRSINQIIFPNFLRKGSSDMAETRHPHRTEVVNF